MAKQNHSLIQHLLLSHLTHDMKCEIAPNVSSTTEQPFIRSEKTAGLSVQEGQQDQKRHWQMCQSSEIAKMSFNSFFYPETSIRIEVLGSSIFGGELPGLFHLRFTRLPKESFCFMAWDINVVCLFSFYIFVKIGIKAQLIYNNIMFLMTNKKWIYLRSDTNRRLAC